MKSSENLLMVADSEHDANMLYAVGMFVPDPFIYLRIRGRELMVIGDLEIDRARRRAPHCRVLSLNRYQDRLRRAGIKAPGLTQVIREILREKRVRRVTVPSNFPLGLATELQRLRIPVKARPGMFFPAREKKSAAEIKKISAALVMAE
ncbi:MAG: aminopeptidase P family protein, partial [Anaerolineae bacterium]|nr:aminopeptidase P family protein [Anaerolineae bacterium]